MAVQGLEVSASSPWARESQVGVKLTVSPIVLNNASHTHGRGAFEKSARDNGVGLRDSLAAASDGQDAVVDALNNLADASLDASLISEVGNVLATLADDDAGFLGGDDGAESQLSLGVLLVRLRGGFAIRTEAVVKLEIVQRVDEVSAAGLEDMLRSRHGYGVLRCPVRGGNGG